MAKTDAQLIAAAKRLGFGPAKLERLAADADEKAARAEAPEWRDELLKLGENCRRAAKLTKATKVVDIGK